MAVLDQVMRRLMARRVARQPARLAQPSELTRPAGDELVHVSLVTCVPHDRVGRAVEDAVQSECELDDAEVRREVPACPRGLLDEEGPHLRGELGQPGLVECLEIGGRVDRLEDGHLSVNAQPLS